MTKPQIKSSYNQAVMSLKNSHTRTIITTPDNVNFPFGVPIRVYALYLLISQAGVYVMCLVVQ